MVAAQGNKAALGVKVYVALTVSLKGGDQTPETPSFDRARKVIFVPLQTGEIGSNTGDALELTVTAIVILFAQAAGLGVKV